MCKGAMYQRGETPWSRDLDLKSEIERSPPDCATARPMMVKTPSGKGQCGDGLMVTPGDEGIPLEM